MRMIISCIAANCVPHGTLTILFPLEFTFIFTTINQGLVKILKPTLKVQN